MEKSTRSFTQLHFGLIVWSASSKSGRSSRLKLCREARYPEQKALWMNYSKSEHKDEALDSCPQAFIRHVQFSSAVKRTLFPSLRFRGPRGDSGEITVSTVSKGKRQRVQKPCGSSCDSRHTSFLGTSRSMLFKARQGERTRRASSTNSCGRKVLSISTRKTIALQGFYFSVPEEEVHPRQLRRHPRVRGVQFSKQVLCRLSLPYA